MNNHVWLQTTFLTLASLGLMIYQPLSASTVVAEYAIVNTPSNVRDKPNGKIICRLTRKVTISVYHFTNNMNEIGSPINGYYSTNACGNNKLGWIYQSQIKLTGK
jgi:hypothetical protein